MKTQSSLGITANSKIYESLYPPKTQNNFQKFFAFNYLSKNQKFDVGEKFSQIQSLLFMIEISKPSFRKDNQYRDYK